MKRKYSIGLDIGTNSVGWAVLENDTFKVMKRGNNKLWGVRLFEAAKPASERRGFRSTRRRYDRRRKRIKLLQQEFKEEILKEDKNFFKKMKESFYNEKDFINKTIQLTVEEKKEIQKYNKKYPTIYHLRKDLIESTSKKDIRLVYLALHHIIKYRGNFNYTNNNFSVNNLNIISKLEESFENLYNLCDEIEFNNIVEKIDYNEIEKVLLIESKSDRKKYIKNILNNYLSKNSADELSKLLSGYQFSISRLFNIDVEEDIRIRFDGNDFDENYDRLEKMLNVKIEVLNSFKELYDAVYLKLMFKNSNNTSLSDLMVERFLSHQNDLIQLKDILREDRKKYNYIFKTKNEENPCQYDLYISNSLSYDEFTKEIIECISNINNNKLQNKIDLIEEKIKTKHFMPLITSIDNGKYPYQLNREELVKIIENQGKYYPFLLNKIDNGIYKLVKLLEFKIPYYVGPLNNSTNIRNVDNKNAWLIRKSNEIITPYNFSDVVDLEKSAQKFIKKMISHCTYLLDEYVMPNNSILYSKYKVINELKQIKINNYKLSKNDIIDIYNNLFLKTSGSITAKILKNYLKTTNNYNMYDELIITGYSSNEKFANNMQSYVDFFGENGIFNDTKYNVEDAENIINYVTIFEDKKILKSKLERDYSNLSDKAINKIINLKYSGWSSLSKKLLTGIYYFDKKTNNYKSIMDLLEETNENFMQIINNDKYDFQKRINENNKIYNTNKLDYSVVDKLVTSPAIKRGIYQSLKIVEELVDYIGYQPENIMIEMLREEGKKNRTESRKEYITKLYQTFREQINDYKKLNSQLNKIDKIDSQKLFLYFIQEGKSLYSGLPINIEELNTDKYEIDHIIPQTLIKDDSIDNKALVLREENQLKSASYTVPKQYRNQEQQKWWNHLNKCNLISNKKLYNLNRKEYNTDDIEGFINRQLVETRQITKHVANILGNYYSKSDIIYLKAGLSHNYREKFELFKFRQINDYHHAHDAYLATVLGVYKKYYLKDSITMDELKSINKKLYDEKRYREMHYGYIINSLDNSYSIKNKKTGEIIPNKIFNDIVENTLYQNDIFITMKTEYRTGQFYKAGKHKARSKGNGLPLKENMPIKLYGRYSDIVCSYMTLIGKNDKKKIIGIPLIIDIKSRNDKTIKEKYIREHLLLKENETVEIIKDHIPYNSLLMHKSHKTFIKGYSISHKNSELCNAVEFNFDKNSFKKYKYTLNHLLNGKKIENELIYNNNINELLQYLFNKINKYYPLYKNIYDNLLNIDNSISIEQKEKTIIELFKMLSANSINANLSELNIKGLANSTGRMNDQSISSGTIITQSITGIKESRYEF